MVTTRTRCPSRPVLLAVAVASLGCRGMASRKPPVHLNPNMDAQAKYDPQEASTLFADGRAMRPWPEGTVPVGSLRDDEHLHGGRGADGGWATTLPEGMKLDRALLERGRERYEIYCTPCHDSAGTGMGPAVARGMLQPPSFHDDRLRSLPVGQIQDVVANGIRNMPAYRAQVPVEDRWAIAAYVRALQLSRDRPIDDVPEPVRQAEGWTP